jgi:hypothetical protein
MLVILIISIKKFVDHDCDFVFFYSMPLASSPSVTLVESSSPHDAFVNGSGTIVAAFVNGPGTIVAGCTV